MLTQLRIQNFKAWRDTGMVRLAPITVFFGTNSSGKTSLLQLLLMLKQTAESPDRRRVLHFGDRNSLIDLGTFHDLVFRHDEKQPIKFDLEWNIEDSLEILDVLRKKWSFHGSRIHFQSTVQGPLPLTVREMNYVIYEDSSKISVSMKPKSETKAKYEIRTYGYELKRNPGRVWNLPPPSRFYGFPDEAIAYYQNSSFLADLALKMENVLQSIHYIGPLREYPQRAYIWSGEIPEDVDQKGGRAVEAILAAIGRKLNRGFRKRSESFMEVIVRWLRDMGLIDSFQVKAIASNRKEHEVLIKTIRSESEVNLTDVGFGLSQVLPVIVQCFYTPRNSILIFEQPEIHLHPSVQASLADLFVEAIASREKDENRRIQILVESHSEHFLRRLQTLIAEEKLQQDDVALFFCESGPEGSTIRALELNEHGKIKNWPVNFFGDITGEVEKQARSILQRSQATAKA